MAFAEGRLSGTRQSLCRGPTWPSAKKSNHNGAVFRDGVFAEGLYLRPSAKKLSRFFFKKFFARQRRGPPPAALGKENAQIFLKKFFANGYKEALGKDPVFVEGLLAALGKECTQEFFYNFLC